MTSINFAYWLQGYFELNGKNSVLTHEQVEIIKNHLALVFKHEIDPSYGGNQEELQAIHDGKPQIGGVDPVTGQVYRC